MKATAAAERLMSMDDATWARHANPWSGWTRVTALPLLALAVWSRAWVGHWAWLLGAIVIIWIWLNPRLFPAPRSTDNWMSKGVLGERVWLNQSDVPIPAHHKRVGIILNSIAGAGLIPFTVGLVLYDLGMTLFGMSVAMLAKFWFLDRMVWLYDTMRRQHPPYESWMRSRSTPA
ncbi:MAG: hypothetical protein MRY74_01065 [Neomegalonema sp.]|nr:hypothetical protein [Neomegalonema sp.]